MKKKNVLIVSYYNNADFRNKVNMEVMHHKIVKLLESEGKEVYTTSKMFEITRTTFQDGSTVVSGGFGAYLRGQKFTHVYIDEKLAREGIDMNKVFTHGNFSVDFKDDNIFTYSVEENSISIENYKG